MGLFAGALSRLAEAEIRRPGGCFAGGSDDKGVREFSERSGFRG